MQRLLNTVLALAIAVTLATASFMAGFRLSDERGLDGFEAVLQTARDLREGSAAGLTEEELARAAIRGMLEALEDPYAAYLSPEQKDQVDGLLGGSIVGIGVWLEQDDAGLRVTSVVEGTPAEESGLRPGDLLVEAAGHTLAGLTLDEASGFIRGPEGSAIDLVVHRDGRSFELSVERARIQSSDVQGRLLDGNVAYVRLSQFGSGAADELGTKIRGLLGDGARQVVLDLRRNAGGLASEAFEVAGLFIEDGVVAHIREPGSPEEDVEAEGDALPSFPLALLVDGGTASASELVAGALQDRDRATLVGTRTYGKGSVLTVTDVADETSIQYTTAFFYTPDGHQIEGRGIEPDVTVLPGGVGDAQLRRALEILLAAA